jgi:hypothetical protein
VTWTMSFLKELFNMSIGWPGKGKQWVQPDYRPNGIRKRKGVVPMTVGDSNVIPMTVGCPDYIVPLTVNGGVVWPVRCFICGECCNGQCLQWDPVRPEFSGDQTWTSDRIDFLPPQGKKAMVEEVSDKINSPKHYRGKDNSGLEVVDVIEIFDVGARSPTSGFNLGNSLKYLLRAGLKGDYLEDLKKLRWYVQREIDNETDRRGAKEVLDGGKA